MEEIITAPINLPFWLLDAIKDSVNILPWLFIIFVIIEVFENYFSSSINSFLKYSKKFAPLLGSIIAIIPQCGFSVIASILFVKKYITAGTLIAVYIATSDEAIPILLTSPNSFPVIIKLLFIKLLVAIFAGYLVDFIFKSSLETPKKDNPIKDEKGCCKHKITENKFKTFILHPVKHTLNIFFFIFIVCAILNYLFQAFGAEEIAENMLKGSLIQPIVTGFLGLIPNCAISVLITMMFIKGTLTFGSTVSGLSTGAGLGLLILLQRNKNAKENLFITATLLLAGISAGIMIQLFYI